MRDSSIATTLLALLGACAMLVASTAGAQDVPRHQVIDGISVYLGVMPISQARNEADELKLDHKVYQLKNRYYLLIALFDNRSGRRIVDADIDAQVEAIGGLNFSAKPLKPVHIEKVVNYGNYFHMADPDIYRVELRVKMPERETQIPVSFEFQRPEI